MIRTWAPTTAALTCSKSEPVTSSRPRPSARPSASPVSGTRGTQQTAIFGSIPTIGAAIAAECPWLRFYCPARRQIGEVDLRKLGRHRGATIESLIAALSCRRCRPIRRLRSCWASQLFLSTSTTSADAYRLTWAEIVKLYRFRLRSGCCWFLAAGRRHKKAICGAQSQDRLSNRAKCRLRSFWVGGMP
jgi:hypothetical protein